MAGIGFQLHKLIEDESFLNKAKAFIFASIITSGPWILSIICLALLGILSGAFVSGVKFSIISITVVYTFAFTLIVTGPIQFVLTRYLADKEYMKQKEDMLSALLSALFINLVVSLVLTIPWYAFSQGFLAYKIISILLFIVIGSIWTMMDFLSCLKRYKSIIFSFLFGSALSVVLLPLLGHYFGLAGALLGYTAGQLTILIMLIYNITREYSFNGFINREYFRYLKSFPFIFFTGLFYNLGLWIDKLIGWFFFGETIYGNFKAFSLYDTPVFIAYLSIIPSLAYFIIQAETRFYLVHRRFFDSIAHETLYNILQFKEELISLLKSSLLKLFLIQLATSFIGYMLAGFIGKWFGLLPPSVSALRVLFFAAGAQVLFLYIIIFMMYFDLSQFSFYMVLLFFILNLSLNSIQVVLPNSPLGMGYLVAITLSLLVGLGVLLHSVSDIEYSIFQSQEN